LIGWCVAALDRGDIDQALRISDRAVRLTDDNFHIHLLRGTVLVVAAQPALASAHFSRAIALGGSPDGEIGLIQAKLALGDIEDAAQIAALLLSQYSVADFPNIAAAARSVCLARESVGGWFSFTSDDRIVGEVRRSSRRKVRIVATGILTGRILTDSGSVRLAAATEDFERFDLPISFDGAFEPISVSRGQAMLLGGPASGPRAARLEGFVARDGDRLDGWALLPGYPSLAPDVQLLDARGKTLALETKKSSASDPESVFGDAGHGTYRFSLQLRGLPLDGDMLEVWAYPPNSSIGRQLAGSPLTAGDLRAAKPSNNDRPSGKRPSGRMANRAIDIVVPVYGGLDETRACLDSVLATRAAFPDRGQGIDIVVIDDGSPPGALTQHLDDLASQGKIQLLRNARNLGFPAAVNRGFALHTDRDVVVLNSDAVVFNDWLARLRAAAYSAGDIGTATPFSNEASILSYPGGSEQNPALLDENAAALDRLAREVNRAIVIDIPTAVGFCMYVRRDCLDQVGPFDVASFGRGYGEENDFCMRGRKLGWRHVAATDVFVTHLGGRSFGPSKTMLVKRNIKILNRLHPDYDRTVAAFIAADPLAPARRNLDVARLLPSLSAPAVLIITLDLVGGVARHVQARADDYLEKGKDIVVLQPAEGRDGRCILRRHGDAGLRDLIYRLPDEFEILVELLSQCGIESIELHHFLGLHPKALEIPERLAVPYEIVVHDYSWLCPRITLLDGRIQYCGMPPDVEVCERCIAIDGSSLDEDISVAALRRRSQHLFSKARRVTAGCADVISRFRGFIPKAAYRVVPWEPTDMPPPAAPKRPLGRRVRIAIIGAIGDQKGYRLLLNCARDAALRDLPIEFVVIGFTEDDLPLFRTGRVFVTGRYHDREALDLIRSQQCDFAFFPSASPETWSYALTLAWKAGLSALAFDFGALAERIRETGYGGVMPFCVDERVINKTLLTFADGHGLEVEPIIGGATAHFCKITAHIRNRGDIAFDGAGWAGVLRQGLWIEAFTIDPPAGIASEDLEYKAITARGWETPWASGGAMCGTRGAGLAIIGFAIRLRGVAAHRYECLYSGAFFDGGIVGPIRNGNPCTLGNATNPLEGIQLAILETSHVRHDIKGTRSAAR
jgi:GT2 family glycosyltransferase/glycosyltransferase involved in cell wall biosynthesis